MFCTHTKGYCNVMRTFLKDIAMLCTYYGMLQCSAHIAQGHCDASHTLRDVVMFCTRCSGTLQCSAHTTGCCSVLHTLLKDVAASTYIAQGCCDVLHIQTDLRTNNR